MNFEQYSLAFSREASQSGYTEQSIIRCLKYAEKLFSNKVPVIYNTSHLSVLVGYRKNYLKKASFYTPYFYRNFEILKKNGSKRIISEPLPSLKEIQIWILNNILYNIEVSRFAKAYIRKSHIKQNLVFHKGQLQVLKLDIENFFTSIKLSSIQDIFMSVWYSQLISNLLAKLCCHRGSLPQGGPTSPYLSNLYLKSVDESIYHYCMQKEIRFTRYADDMTFSGVFEEKGLIKFVTEELRILDLKINEKKTKMMSRSSRQLVTGVVVNEKLQVPFYKRNKLRQDLYYIKKFGLENHMQRRKITKSSYIEHLLGKINFILSINQEDQEFLSYKNYLIELKRKSREIRPE
ncbi:MAG: RNA-directed DNA polymerase [Chitinophagaceae bacterium]|nr:RNA-directed DNA polymerase [Chitinophagaceae bacterium]